MLHQPHTPQMQGSPAQTPQLQGVGVQTPVCTWGCETAFPLPSPSARLLPASPGAKPAGQSLRGLGGGPQGLSPQVRKKVIARAPLCSQGRDGSEVQPTPLVALHGAGQVLSLLSRCARISARQPLHTAPPLWSSQHVHCTGAWPGGARARVSDQHCPGPRSSRAGPLAPGHLGSQEPLWVSFTSRPGRREAGPWNPMTRSPEAWDQQLSPSWGACGQKASLHPELREGAAPPKHASTSGVWESPRCPWSTRTAASSFQNPLALPCQSLDTFL